MKSSRERDKLHRTIWTLAYNLRGALDGYVKTIGTDIDNIMPNVSMFDDNNSRIDKKERIIEKLFKFFEKYFWVV